MNTQYINNDVENKDNSVFLMYSFLAIFGLSAIAAGLAFDRSAAMLVVVGAFSLFAISYSSNTVLKNTTKLKGLVTSFFFNISELGKWLLTSSAKQNKVNKKTRLDSVVMFIIIISAVVLTSFITFMAFEYRSWEGVLAVGLSVFSILLGLGLVYLLGNIIMAVINTVSVAYSYKKNIALKLLGALSSLVYLSTFIFKVVAPLFYVLFMAYAVKYEGTTGMAIVAGLFVAKVAIYISYDLIASAYKSRKIVSQIILQSIRNGAYTLPIENTVTPTKVKVLYMFNADYKDQLHSQTNKEKLSDYGSYAGLALKGLNLSSIKESLLSKQSSNDDFITPQLAL